MTKRKILLLAMSLCMVAILAVGGTLAYFTDTDNADNVFTIGHVNIALNEQQRPVVNGQPAHGGALEPFVDNKPLFPIVGSAQGEKDDFGLVKAANYVDKIITIKNLNDSQDAWVRVYLAVPSILDNVNPGLNVLHFNFGNNFATGIYSTADYANWGAETLLTTGYEIDGVNYNIYFRDYNKIMALIGREDLKDDPRLVNCVKMNEAGLNPEVVGILDEALGKMTAAEALALFQGNGIPCELCQTPLDVYEDQNALVNGYLTKVAYPDGGRWVATPPCQFDSEPIDPGYQPTGMAGSATFDVMHDLGYTDEQIAAAVASGDVEGPATLETLQARW
jgi:predicted ribosomally synthesized peptide with SipW-like signal peptide